MPRSRRNEEEDNTPVGREYEAETPWNQLRNTVDQLAQVSPLDSVRKWYFVRHSTGLSYAYLLASMLVAGAFMAMLLVRWSDDNLIENTTFESVEFVSFFTDAKKAEEGINVPTGLAWYLELADGTKGNDAEVEFRYLQCVADAGLHPAAAAGGGTTTVNVACSQMDAVDPCEIQVTVPGSAATQTVNATCLDQSNVEEPAGFMRGTPAAANWKFVRVQATLRDGADDAAKDRLTGARVTFWASSVSEEVLPDELPVLRENAATYNTTETFDLAARYAMSDVGAASRPVQSPRMVYEAVRVNNLPKVFVDGDEGNFASYQRTDAESYQGVDAASRLLFEATMELGPRRRVVNVQFVNLWDLLGQWWSLMLVLVALGIAVRLFNRWHFYQYGSLESAGLPRPLVSGVLDPRVPITTPGLTSLLDMHETRKADAVTADHIRDEQRKLAVLRRSLDEAVRLRRDA